ncbi:MAG: hypothetical protein HOW73_11520 [Polyangiaceae bacterium]|nr:hypothetical protein [Polyangiaceae bacterium]
MTPKGGPAAGRVQVVVAGFVLSAIPFVGGFLAFGCGLALIVLGRRAQRDALLQAPTERLVDIVNAPVNEVVRVRGTIVASSSITAPSSGTEVALVHTFVARKTSNIGHESRVWGQVLSVPFEVRDGSGLASADVDESVSLYSSRSHALTWTGWPPEVVEAQLNPTGTFLETRIQNEEVSFVYREVMLCAGDQVEIAGQVVRVEQLHGRGGFRDAKREARITIRPTRVTNVLDEQLEANAERGRINALIGALYIVLGIGSMVVWAVVFL